MTTLFGRAPPSEIGGDEEDHYKEFGVKGSSFTSGIWCLYGVFPSLIGQCISETNGHSEHACDLKRKGRPENEGLGNYDLMDEGNDVVIIKLEVVSRKGPNS